ncbi:nucleotidyltransferase family protein [Paenibacillus sp. FSL W8-1187]|uniref:nucleotidyltransferase family protein n=1 Tax=Paenibacillus sp. FSL W8-1187 TaxID=2975339 RepID=UPI0030DC7EAB
MRAVAICLAAGAGSRMGGAKPARELAPGVSLGSAVLSELAASGVERVVAVLRPGDDGTWLPSGAGAARPDPAGCWPPLERVTCPDADQGMAHSLRCGLAAALGSSGDEPRLDAVLIALADQPFADAALMRRLLARLAERPELDWTACAGTDGLPVPPVALRSTMFDAVWRLSGDQGARKLLRDKTFQGDALHDVPEQMLLDADTPEELERLRQAWERMHSSRSGIA